MVNRVQSRAIVPGNNINNNTNPGGVALTRLQVSRRGAEVAENRVEWKKPTNQILGG